MSEKDERSGDTYDGCCHGCAISRGDKPVTGGTIDLPGNWVLNHYAGPEGYLGWMAMQPRFHRMALACLSPNEINALGSNVQRVEHALVQYWQEHFRSDPVQRLYVVYFFESVFNRPPSRYHLHLHLIPRFQELERMLRRYTEHNDAEGCPYTVDAWSVPFLTSRDGFPSHYRKSAHSIAPLMEALRREFPEPPNPPMRPNGSAGG